jgi:predicted P-loop ATPase
VLAYDQFSNRILFTKAPPWSDEAASNVTIVIGDAWSDTDADRLVDWLGRTWKVNISPEMAGRLAILIARKSTKNPLREYLVAMAKVWDQAPRIDRFAITHLGAEATPYHLLVGRFALMQSAARGLMPGCIAQHVPVLEGDQDLGKSTAIKRLSPNVRWVSETPFSIGTKDGYVALQGKWLVELAEAETLMRAENRAAKAFFTAESDSYRVPYGKINEDFPRPCVFWATINPEGEGYLRDPTGNRRYWPIACGRIDLAAIERDRDQLWGEAAARVLAGERYHPETADEKRLCGEVQNERREIPVIHDKIASAVAAYNHVTTAYLFEQVLGVKLAEVKNAEQTRVCSVLTSLGFESKTVRFKHPEDEKRSFVRRVWTRRVPLDPLHEKAFVPSDDGASNIALDPRATMKSPMEHDWLGGLS